MSDIWTKRNEKNRKFEKYENLGSNKLRSNFEKKNNDTYLE